MNVRLDASEATLHRLPGKLSPKIRRLVAWKPIFGKVAESVDGYTLVWIQGKGYIREHRLVASKALGRRLRKHEVVHHIDGNKANNVGSNLLICSRAYHKWLHQRCLSKFGTWHLPRRAA